MAHRSNQAVASQDQAPLTPDEPPPPRRFLIGWVTAVAALGVSTSLVGLGLWFTRLPLADFMIGAALSERGVEADFQVDSLDFGGVTLTNVRFGAIEAPDAAIQLVEASWRWNGLMPELDAVRLTEPMVRLRLTPRGEVSAGTLDRLGGGPRGRQRLSIPEINFEIVDGNLFVEAPFGEVQGDMRASGRIGEDFSAVARIAETSRTADNYTLERGQGELVITSRENEDVTVRFSASMAGVKWSGAEAADGRLLVLARTPVNLEHIDLQIAWRIGAIDSQSVDGSILEGAFGVEALMRDDALELAAWEAQGRVSAVSLAVADLRMQRPRFTANAEGSGRQGRARWTLGGDRFEGLTLISQQPAASGRLTLGEDGALSGDALVTLARSALNADAQADMRRALPELNGTPIGPTFAQARVALDRAADSFTLTAPLLVAATNGNLRITLDAPAEARAATGARLRLGPLRQDAPAMVVQWPGPTAQGSVALELSGGGAPSVSLLLDTVTSSEEAPFEADGTLTLADWRAGNASISAAELGITISAQANGGRIDLRGPALISGPVGDGEIRDLTPTLNLGIHWGEGWRVTPNSGCLPVRMGGLDVAGLSFANGAFSLCPLDGALMAADARNNLSGGFSIQQLALNGQMAGPDGQPARVAASNVIGRFGGRTGDIALALVADRPSIGIDMADDRTLTVALQRITANARIADTWRVDGAFEQGALSDPTLPGSVSTIEGGWTAAPEDGKPVIRVTAAEAVLTANRPATDNERPLFNPLRLVDVDAVLREGVVDASGAILLDGEERRQLANFTARHVINEGAGTARILAADLTFGPDLQPYDITERTRGLVDNVTGGADVTGDIVWTREAITSTGRVLLRNVSLATSTIPIVETVNGEIYFDDLFALTTPPGQQVHVGVLNPGVEVSNGRVRFQLLTDQRVSIENAEFDFASGVLEMRPTTITLGADETRFELQLRDVDASSLLSTLNVPDLQATGRLEGSFPLILTRRSAFVEGGVVRAQGEGGTISYTGPAGQDATGVSRIAFDALRSFRYDTLSLTLDGDLNGDVISSIEFSGRNTGRPVDLGPIAPVPGLGSVTVRGVPFEFNVRVSAPFRRLAQTAATITDPGSLIEQGRNGGPEETVDQDDPSSE